MENIFLIIVLIVVISLISSAARKKKPAKKDEESAPARMPSDIQKAFMLMDDRRRPSAARPVYGSAPQNPASPDGALQSKATERLRSEGLKARTAEAYTGSMGVISQEGIQAPVMASGMENTAVYTPQKANIPVPVPVNPMQPNRIKLFENQHELVKAVIYSEILTRKKPQIYAKK